MLYLGRDFNTHIGITTTVRNVEKNLIPLQARNFAVTPKYDNYQLWIPGRQVGFVAESGKIPACSKLFRYILKLFLGTRQKGNQ